MIEDSGQAIYSNPANYNDTLPAEKYSLAAKLLIIPRQMLEENGKQYHDGTTDCSSYSIKAYIQGKEYTWRVADCVDDESNIIKE